MSDINLYGKWLVKFLQTAYKKLNLIGAINLTVILAFVFFLCIESLSNFFIRLAIIISSRFLEWKKINPIPIPDDNTPFWLYAISLLCGLLICMWIVGKHQKGELWPEK
jgi:hypothetical protein